MSNIIMVGSAILPIGLMVMAFCDALKSTISTQPLRVPSEMKADIFRPRHHNPPTGSGGPNHWEVWLRDPDGYTVVLASPDGSAR